jgi:tRNA (guanine10-N2)-methyltransferase
MWYLCVFFHRYLDYRKPEVESLAQLFGAFKDNQNDVVHPQLQWKLPLHHHPDSPFHLVNLPSEEIARNIANRSQFSFSQCILSSF